MQDGRGSATSLSGRGSLLEAEKCLSKLVFSLYTNRAGRKWWQWLWWVISSRGKPRSQWVWPTAVHLEPKRLGEDLLGERRGERHRGEVESEGDSSLCQMHSVCHISPAQCRGYAPTCSGFKLTPDIWPPVSLWTFHNMSSESPSLTVTFNLLTEQHFRFDPNRSDFLCKIFSTTTITKHYKVPVMQRRVKDTHRAKSERISMLHRACVQQMQQCCLTTTDRRTDQNLPLCITEKFLLHHGSMHNSVRKLWHNKGAREKQSSGVMRRERCN